MRPFEQKLAAAWPTDRWADLTVLAAVSGGADSVALLHALAAVRAPGAGRIVAIHFNHALRGEAADDERFVAELAGRLNCEFHAGRCDVRGLAGLEGDGLEAAARQARLQFFERAAAACGARYVATGHTADDQAETILHRIVRGTGLRGLAGMRRARPLGPATLIRPLLELRRADTRDYLRERGEPFREDASNADLRFTRNRIRHELLPAIAEHYNPAVADALLRLGGLAGEACAALAEVIERLIAESLAEAGPAGVTLDCGPLRRQSPYLIREALAEIWRRQNWPLQEMGHAEWQWLGGVVLDSRSAARTLPGRIEAKKQGAQLTLTRLVD